MIDGVSDADTRWSPEVWQCVDTFDRGDLPRRPTHRCLAVDVQHQAGLSSLPRVAPSMNHNNNYCTAINSHYIIPTDAYKYQWNQVKRVKVAYTVAVMELHLTATGCHLPYGITVVQRLRSSAYGAI